VSDPFAKIRARRRPQPAVATDDVPLASYATPYFNRVWAILILLAWAPIMIALTVWLALSERAIKDAMDYGTGVMVLAMFALFASLVFVPMMAGSRRAWTLYADRLKIVQRPFVPLLGRYRNVALPLGDIAVARMGEALNAMPIVEIEATSGARYRLVPKHIGKGRDVTLDIAGFETFVDRIGAAIVAAGYPRPPGERMDTPGSGLSGVVILSVITGLLGALSLFGIWMVISGEPVGMQALALGGPLMLIFAGLLRSRWAKWRSGTG
jgi:hypothetical protein